MSNEITYFFLLYFDLTLNKHMDSNLNVSNIQGEATLRLSDLLATIPLFVKESFSDDATFRLVFKNKTLHLSQFVLPPVNLATFYDKNKFNSNFFQSFEQDFPTILEHQYFFGLEIKVSNDLPISRLSYLDKPGEAAFRFLTCLIFGLNFSLNLPTCACYPKNLAEYAAARAGLGLNCVNLDCKNLLKLNPTWYDDLLNSGDCSNSTIQAAFVSFSAFAGGSLNSSVNINQQQVKTNISQTTRNLSVLGDPLYLLPVGTIITWPKSKNISRTNFLRCDGRTICKWKYPNLYDIYGSNLPDLKLAETRLDNMFRFLVKAF